MSAALREEIPDSVWLPIALEVCRALNVPVQKMMHGGNTKRFVIARMRFWKRLRDLPAGYSHAAIGNITGHHRSTVLNGVGHSTDSLVMRAPPKRDYSKPPANPWPQLIGKRFGRLVVIARAPAPTCEERKVRWWLCRCTCGSERTVPTAGLVRGKTRSCGKDACKRSKATQASPSTRPLQVAA